MTRLRRALLLAGLAAALTTAASAAPAPDAQVEEAVDALTRAMLAADGPALDGLVLDGLSYGHSSGVVQTKPVFVDSIATRKSAFSHIDLKNRSAEVVGEDAVVRHVFDGETISDGKTAPVHIGVLQVWHRDGGRWRLLARQAYKL